MYRLGFFWNTVNFVDFSVIRVSQGSVATYVRCGGMSAKHCIANFLLSLSVKEFLKSVKVWQSYCTKFGGDPFLEHSVEVRGWWFNVSDVLVITEYTEANEWMNEWMNEMNISVSWADVQDREAMSRRRIPPVAADVAVVPLRTICRTYSMTSHIRILHLHVVSWICCSFQHGKVSNRLNSKTFKRLSRSLVMITEPIDDLISVTTGAHRHEQGLPFHLPRETRKLCYRKDDRAMCPI